MVVKYRRSVSCVQMVGNATLLEIWYLRVGKYRGLELVKKLLLVSSRQWWYHHRS